MAQLHSYGHLAPVSPGSISCLRRAAACSGVRRTCESSEFDVKFLSKSSGTQPLIPVFLGFCLTAWLREQTKSSSVMRKGSLKNLEKLILLFQHRPAVYCACTHTSQTPGQVFYHLRSICMISPSSTPGSSVSVSFCCLLWGRC